MSRPRFYGVRPPGLDETDLPGRLIVIEGTDGVGRSTNVELLKEWLEARGYAVVNTGLRRSELAGLGIVVVKALGGEQVPMKAGTSLVLPDNGKIESGMSVGGPRVYHIPAGTTYRPGTLTLEGGALSDAADADAGEFTGTGIAVRLGTVAGGGARTVTFQVAID